MNKISISTLVHVFSAAILSVIPLHHAQSAPGTLPTAPLFLSTIVEPNVFFTLDDSGSMDYELVVEDTTAGIPTSNGLPTDDNGDRIGYLHPSWSQLYSARSTLPPSNGTLASWDKYWVLRNFNGNKLYYNPGITYTPWSGSKADGTAMYSNADETNALDDPDNPAGQSVDLTVKLNYGAYSAALYLPTYFIWTDTDGDGVIEQSDARTMVEITPGSAEMQNFANWFVYYRSRINTSKAAIGDVINNTDTTRMGLRLFNQGHTKDLKSMTDNTFKREFLESFYNVVIPAKGTPGRRALQNTGDMFKNSTSGAILSAANGGECQQNFNIFMSDGFWNGSVPAPSVGNADADLSSIFDGGSYADGESNTLADVAMHYYETDLSTLADLVPVQSGVDEAEHQHLVNFSIAFGINGQLIQGTDSPLDTGFSWPVPVSGTSTTVDDMWHAAYNSRGSYLNAQNPVQLQQSLSAAVTNISERTGTAAAVAVNSAQLSTESVVYLAQFNTNRWQGNLFAYPIIDQNTGELAATPKWDASSALTARNLTSKPRNIITFDNSPSVADGIAFQWGDLSAAMKLDLNTNPSGGTDADAVGTARLEYLRGDRSNEGTGYAFRERLSLLGDLVNSGPVFVGQPNLVWPDYAPFPVGSEAYSEFKNGSAAARQKIVYVGANDGMLHAFDDSSGEEVFGYIPGLAYSQTVNKGLHYLTDPNYIHNYYVDLTPTVSDVYISSGSSVEWHTVLVGGMRSGGRGVFALNVTNPAAFSEANAASMVLWEFTSDDDADLGYTFSRPFVGLTNAGTWVAIFGNGYNSTGTGEASLFILDIAKGVDGKWITGDYQKIPTGAGSAANPNGLAESAVVDLDGNGTLDRVYAGDLLGNMWAFDLSSTNSNLWESAYKSGSTPAPLFTAQSDDAVPTLQQITAKPVLANHPTQPDSSSPSNAPNLMVYFGTGQYLVNADKATNNLQSYYGVWDKGDSALANNDLVQQTFDGSFSGRVLTRNAVDYATDYGWYFNLTDSGERAVTASIARDDTVFFNSFVPENDPCSSGGFGYKFVVDMATGGSPLTPSIDSNNDGVIDDNDYQNPGFGQSTLAAVRQEGYLPEPVFIEDLSFTADIATKVKALPDIPVGRFSWQELIK